MGEATATVEAEAPVSSWVVEMEKTIGEMNIDPAAEMARWKRHSIYRVPERIKNLHNSKAYQPELVSLGPFHHGDPELLPMEEHKRRAVVHLVKRSGRPLREFVAAVAEVAQQLQDAYKDLGDEWRGAEGGGTERFVQLMVTDGCFLVEAMRMDALRGKVHEEYAPNDPVFSKYGYLYLWNYIQSDMVVVENQLPLLLLQRLLIVLDHHKYQNIIECGLGSDEEVVKLLNNTLNKGGVMSPSSRLHDVQRRVKAQCTMRRNKWRANFIQRYLRNPWVFISLVAAVVLLVATLLQTVYTVLPFYKII
ncbi:unnamed protein product [Triticum turgidum subsp. durum]|uniref:Uncharacterized protein n=1 Tax=Triticum turgidum subsp. durum TaxID=4567 RepID=A0A9R1S7W1_TRITD|nr:unnamed protein product [Triticum turgidum subsp. durum]